MFGRKARAIRSLMRTINQIEHEVAAEIAINEGLRKALVLAMDPNGHSAEAVQKVIDAADDANAEIVKAPDGEFIAPAAYDWERLAHEMRDHYRDGFKRPEDQGGASSSWE